MTGMRALACLVVALGGWASSSCAPSGFQSEPLIGSVRILASSTNPPYAAPGSTVAVQMLAYDGRTNKPAPMAVHWWPLVCMNPPNDAYYACFQQFVALGQRAADAGAGTATTTLTACAGETGDSGISGGLPQIGDDLTRFLSEGDCAQFAMPASAIPTRNPAPTVPYGLAILFNFACAGHLELVPRDPGNVQAPPIGCFDSQHNRLGPNDYVFGFTRVYAYDTLHNANPIIDHVDVEGQAIDLQSGFSVQHCSPGSNCSIHIGPVVLASSQEDNPIEHDVNGNALREQIWAQYFSTFGSFANEARLLYDATTGSLGSASDTDNQFHPPDRPGEGTIWIVVHDNRGGASWVTVPVHVL